MRILQFIEDDLTRSKVQAQAEARRLDDSRLIRKNIGRS